MTDLSSPEPSYFLSHPTTLTHPLLLFPHPHITVLGSSPSGSSGRWSRQCLQYQSPSGTSITFLNCLLGTFPQQSQPVYNKSKIYIPEPTMQYV